MIKHDYTKARSWSHILFLFFILTTLLAPAAPINKIIFAIILLTFIFYFFEGLFRKLNITFSPFIIFGIFSYGLILSFHWPSDPALSRQFFLGSLTLFLIYSLRAFSIELNRLAKISGLIVATVTLGLLGLLITLGAPFMDTTLWRIFTQYGLGASGERGFTENAFIMFHIGSAPFLFLPFSLFACSFMERPRVSSLASLVLLSIAVVASTSRGLVIICLLALLFIILIKGKGRFRLWMLSAAILGCMGILAWAFSSTDILNSQEPSNSAKLGHLASYLERVSVEELFTGKGLASMYFSKGFGAVTPHTEITPLDMLRFFGVPLTLILYGSLLLPVLNLKAYKGKSLTILIFNLYLALSFTNPVLFNSAGLLVVLWYWNEILPVQTLPRLLATPKTTDTE